MSMSVIMTAKNEVTASGSRAQVLVLSASRENHAVLSAALLTAGLVPLPCSSLYEARKHIGCDHITMVFCDDNLPDGDLKVVVEEASRLANPIPVIAISRTGEWDEFLEALRIGAFDYLALPPRRDEVERVLTSTLSKSTAVNKVQVQTATQVK